MRFGFGSPPVFVETERLALKPVASRDYEAWANLRSYSIEHLRRWEPAWPEDAHSRDDWRRRLFVWNDLKKSGRGYILHIWRKTDKALLGAVSLTNIQFPPISTARLGYWLGAEHTGHGYMREAVQAACNWAHRELEIVRIEAATLPENEPSQAVLENAGFEKEGFARSYLQICGERRDHILYALILDPLARPQLHDPIRTAARQSG